MITIEKAKEWALDGDCVEEVRIVAMRCLLACDKLMKMKRKPNNTEYNKALDDMYTILSEVEA